MFPLSPREHPKSGKARLLSGIPAVLAAWRNRQLAGKALRTAGAPGLVLDLPCGHGQFWPLLGEKHNRVVLAADPSPDVLAHARLRLSSGMAGRLHLFCSALSEIRLDDGAVDCIFCMQGFSDETDGCRRLRMLREFHRVTRDTVIVALSVGGNFQAWRQQRGGRPQAPVQVIPVPIIEAEFAAAGLRVVARHDFLPGYSARRVYTLRKH